MRRPVALAVALMLLAHAVQAATPDPTQAAKYRGVIDQYCITCHDPIENRGNLTLDNLDLTKVHENAPVLEAMVTKLRAGAMPPVGKPRPDPATYAGFATWLTTELDGAAAENPDPGSTPAHRLNRSEYENAVRDLLGLKVNAADLLPPDDESSGFDNNANVLKISPALLERYLSAAWEVSRTAVGSKELPPDLATYRVNPEASQWERMPGLPLGTVGGMAFEHTFPLDAEYEFRVRLWRGPFDTIRGLEAPHQVEVTIDGERVYLGDFGGEKDYAVALQSSGISADQIDNRLRIRVPVKAGARKIGVAFLQESGALVDDNLQPFERTNQDVLNYFGQPHLDRVTVEGPYKPAGVANTVPRQKIFICQPRSPSQEDACAARIIENLARRALRRPVTKEDTAFFLKYYREGRARADFDSGVAVALRAVLSHPEFVFRWEKDPEQLPPGAVYKLQDLEIASRLSFFLWSSIPDAELLDLAVKGRLSQPAVLEKQVKRMLADARAAELVDNFAGQWLMLRNLRSMTPDPMLFPDWDDNLRQAFMRETQLFFGEIIARDHSVLDLLEGDYTYVNDRLARHYGIPGIIGNEFRRITLTDPARFGILGKGSTLVTTAYATRTSPVLRGKWVLSQVLGTPPAPPPPDVPNLKENADTGQSLTVRERMEVHRADPGCASCHAIMDPLGFALENFDAIGRYRARGEDGQAIDASGKLASGQPVNGPEDLRKALLQNPAIFAEAFTRQLMTYALGRAVTPQDMPAVRKVVAEAGRDDYRFSAIVQGIAASIPFQMKKKAVDTAQGRQETVAAH